ncbi:MAG: tetratricopeptide repeat protein [Leptolyngbya sp.]|nr:tetratricopeptide repeat protein [Candidatus Melainabacteria bacterium]
MYPIAMLNFGCFTKRSFIFAAMSGLVICQFPTFADAGLRKYSPLGEVNASQSLDKTLSSADGALAVNASDLRAMWLKAETLRLLGKPLMALPLLEKAAAESAGRKFSKKDQAAIYESLGLCLESIGRSPQAIIAIKKAISLNPTSPETHYMTALLNVWDGQQANALKEFDLYIRQSKSSNSYISKARYLSQIERVDQAIELLKKAEKDFPKLSFINEELAFSYIRKGNPEQAESEADKASSKQPPTANAYAEISRLYRSQRKISESLNAQKKHAKFSSSFESLITLGISLRDRGKIEEAAKVFDQAQILYPESFEPFDRKAKMYKMSGRWKEALEAYNSQISKFHEKAGGAYAGRGECYEHLGDYKKAVADFDVFLSVNKRARELLNRARCLLALKEYKRALEDANYWLSTHPAHITATEVRARAYLGLGKDIDAVKDFNLLIKFNPEQPEVLRLRGAALKRLGKFADANADFTKAESLSGANK